MTRPMHISSTVCGVTISGCVYDRPITGSQLATTAVHIARGPTCTCRRRRKAHHHGHRVIHISTSKAGMPTLSAMKT